jgi:hypothetical protein
MLWKTWRLVCQVPCWPSKSSTAPSRLRKARRGQVGMGGAAGRVGDGRIYEHVRTLVRP